MEPLLRLTPKEFLTGLSTGAHIGTGGIFFKADGITPLLEAGSAQSANNGLLIGGQSGSTIAGSISGNIISATKYGGTVDTTLYFMTTGDKIYKLVLDATLSGTLTDTTWTVASARRGIEHFVSSNGANMIFYFQNAFIGRGVVETATNNSNWSALSGDDIHPSHSAFDKIWFGDSGYVGSIFDDNASLTTSSASNLNRTAFNITRKGRVTDISDDGLYLVIATSKNNAQNTNSMAGCTILFWDTYSTLPIREYQIPDPFIYALERTPVGLFAIGVTGIWQVSVGQEPKKILSIPTGIYSATGSGVLQYGRDAVSHFADSIVWGGTSGTNKVIKTYGKLDSALAHASYLHPFLSTASKNITFVDGQLAKGYLLVGDDTPQLKAYPFSTANASQTGLTAQTVYFPLKGKVQIKRIDLVFGVPLASGDSISASVFQDEATAATSFGTASFTNDGATRRKQLVKTLTVEDQISIGLTYTAGMPRLESIEVWGDPMNV